MDVRIQRAAEALDRDDGVMKPVRIAKIGEADPQRGSRPLDSMDSGQDDQETTSSTMSMSPMALDTNGRGWTLCRIAKMTETDSGSDGGGGEPPPGGVGGLC